MNTIGFIDLHCDTIMVCNQEKLDFVNPKTHISLDKVAPKTRWAQTYAIFVPDEKRGQAAVDYYRECVQYFQGQLSKYSDRLAQIRTAKDLEEAFAAGKFGGILAVEGGAALAGRMEMIEELAKDGVRFLTLTWNGPNEIGSGSVTHNGLSDFGREAIAEMERQGIVVDVSHLNDEGFSDLCKIAQKPFIATHSNSRAICGHSRNLTDAQFCEIRDRGGIVGLNYYRNFIVDGGETQSISDLMKHVHHFLELGGENVIALGSDFDGADIPSYLDSADKVENLYNALLADGLGKELADKIMFQNAYNFIQKNLK